MGETISNDGNGREPSQETAKVFTMLGIQMRIMSLASTGSDDRQKTTQK